MKGIIINEGSPLLENKYVNACYIKNADLTVQLSTGEEISYNLSGVKNKSANACCSKKDTYDFETGALIALMKMCGREKALKAVEELYSLYAPKGWDLDGDVFKNKLQETTDCLNDLSKSYDDVVRYCDTLREGNKGLQEEIKRLKGESENHWKKYQRNIQKKQDRINELEAQVKASEDDKLKNIEYYEKEIKKLKDEIRLYKDANKEFKQTLREQNTKIGDLVCENYKLKTDCEKLQHGYNDMIFCGGRQNGKQYTFLVDLFKKIDQKKVDAAYKEAYNTTLPVWQKEVLKQMYDFTVYRKTEPIKHNDQLDSLLEASKYAIPTEFTFKIDQDKPLTKREEMWGKILGDHKYGESLEVKVEKPFINDFLSEAEDNGLVWANGGEKPTEWDKWESWRTHDYVVFQIWYRGKTKELTWGYPSDEKTINYLPPMRWDLFKKGRKIVRVTPENIDDFIVKCTNKFGSIMKPVLKRYKDFTHVFIMMSDYHYDNKPTIHIMTPEDLVRNQHENPKKYSDKKIVDWEDVR